jgi:hypothetical protein
MKFVHPQFLYGFLALVIPILIHLFNFRRYKKVYFSDTRLLKNIQEESESRNQLKKYLILASRLLAIACLVVCFAQPFFPVDNEKNATGKQFSIYIDNSYSMNAQGNKGSLLDEAKQKAIEMAKNFGKDSEFQLLSQDFSGLQQRWLNYDEFIEKVSQLELSSASNEFNSVYDRQKDFYSRKGNKNEKGKFIWLSDFQKKALSDQTFLSDTQNTVTLLPLRANETGNLFPDSIWFSQPVQQPGMVQKLYVRVTNLSNKEIENSVLNLHLDNQRIAPASFSIKAGEKKNIEFNFIIREAGIHHGYAELQDYPITFDNRMYFSFDVVKKFKVTALLGENAEGAQFIRALFANDSLFEYQEINEKNPDFGKLKNSSLIVACALTTVSSGMAQELRKFCEEGGHIAWFPSEKEISANANTFLNTFGVQYSSQADTINSEIDRIISEDEFYKTVFEKKPEKTDMPKVFSHYTINAYGSTILLPLLNGKPFLNSVEAGKGKLYLFACPASDRWSNFPRHALFVPILIRMCLLSQPLPELYYPLQFQEALYFAGIELKNEQPIHLQSNDGKFDIIPDVRNVSNGIQLLLQNQISLPGNYNMTIDGKTLTGVAFNIRSSESDLSCMANDNLMEICSKNPNFRLIADNDVNLSSKVLSLNRGQSFWKLFLFLTLLFVIIEIILLRFVK